MVEPEVASLETGPSVQFLPPDEPLFEHRENLLPENRKYGSGYPGFAVGVAGYGFPFYFWPLAFGGTLYGANYIRENEVNTPRLPQISVLHLVTANDVLLVRHPRQLESAWRRHGHFGIRIEHSEHDILPAHRHGHGEQYGLGPPE